MAIRDLFARKSVSSNSSGGHTEATATTTNTSDESGGGQESTSPSSKRSSRLAKTWSWRSNKAFKEENKPAKKPKKPPQQQKRIHPSERPLTETNLRHQEMLSSFTFKFGSSRRGRRMSHGQRTSFSGVSPGNSRQASLDQSVGSPGLGPVRGGDRRVSSLAHDVPREDPRGEAETE